MSIRKSLLSKAFVIMISSILLAVTLMGDMALPAAKAEASIPEPTDLVIIHETVRGGFTHPGVGVTKSVLENMREQVIAGQEPWNSYYAAMTKSSYASRTVTSNLASAADPGKPKSIAVNSKGAFVTDGLSAYTQALMYYITGDEVYRANAMAIIRIWEQMDPAQYTYFTDSHIHMGIPLNRMVTAAEILRYTGARNGALSWTEADTAKFTSNLIVPVTETFLHGNNYFMNQHLYPLLGAMSGYIFTDNADRYKEGVEWFTVNRTAVDQGQNGAIRQLFRLVTEDAVTGERLGTPRVQHVEMGRDQAHGAGDLTNVEILGRLLDAQGTKVDPADGTLSTADNAVTAYAFLGNRILKAADYFAQYMLGYDTPWTPVVARYDAEGNPVIYKVLSGAYRGRIGGNVYGQYYYYKYSMGLDIEKEAPYYAEMFNKRTAYYWESPDGGADYWLFIPKEAASEGVSTLPEVSSSTDWTEIEQRATSLDSNAVVKHEEGISYVQVKATEAGSRISVVASSTSLKTVALRIRTNGTARLEVNGWTESELVLPDTKGQWRYITLTMDQYHGLGDLIYFKVTGPGTLVDIDHLLLAPASGLTPPVFTSGPADVNAYAYTGSEARLQVDLSAEDAAAGDTMTYQLDPKPEGAVFNESTGEFSWMPERPGVYSLIVSADDGVAVTAKAVTVTVGRNRHEAVEAASSMYDPETSYISSTLTEYMAMIDDVTDALPSATDEEMYRKLAGLNLAAQGLMELTPLMKDGSMRYFDTIASSTFGTEIGNLIDNAPDSFAGYYLADSLSYILDFGENFKVSATAFALQVRTGFPERIGGAAVYGSNDKEAWTRLTPGVTTVSDAMQTLEVGEAQQEGKFRFLKFQMIEPSSTMFELSELRIYGLRHETHNKLKSVTLSSPQSTQNRVETGSRVDLSFQSAEPIEDVAVTIQGRQASVHTTDRVNWTASVVMDSAMPAGKIKFSVSYTTAGGLPAAPALFTTDNSVLYYVKKSKFVDVTKLARVAASSAQYGNNGLPADKVGYLLFDGNTATYGDLASGNGAYYTLDFGPEASIRLSGVILLPRTGYASRMNGLIIQGSNDELNWSNLTPAVSGAADQSWTYINEEQMKDSKSYRYLRIVNPASWSGNVAEVEIYGEYSIPAAALEAKVKGSEGYTRLSYYQYKQEADRIVEAAGDQGADMLALLNELFQAERLLVTVTELPAERIAVTESMVKASHISWDGKLSEAANGWKAFDGDKATYTDTKVNPGWIVADLGAGNDKALSSFKFYPRSTQAHLGRVNGAILQGSADGESYTDLYTISGITTAEWHSAVISGDQAYRYLRYYSPSGNANVAELEFYQKTADRTLLEYLREQAEGVQRDLYTEESLATLDTAKAAALDLAASAAAAQSAIDAAATGLLTAMEQLVVQPVIVSLNKVEVTTAVGTAPVLPSVVEAVYSDKTVRSLSVLWQDIDPVQYSSVGSFTVTGAVYGTDVPAVANVAVMDEDSPTPPVLPASPTGLTASSITANSLKLGWNAPADHVRVAGYEVLLNGEVHVTVTGDTYEYGFTRLLPDTFYTFRVTAFDDSGNKASSNDYTVKTLEEDQSPPTPSPPPPASPVDGGNTGRTAIPAPVQTVISVHGSRIQVVPAANQGAALITLSAESLEEALKQAIQNKEDTLHIQVQTNAGLSSLVLEFPASAWLKSQREGIRFLSVETGLVSLLIPLDASGNLKETDMLAVSVGQADRSGWQASLSDLLKNKPVYELGLSVNGQSVNVFANGSVVKVIIPYSPQADESVYGLVAASLNDVGSLEVIRNSKYDRTTGRLVFGAKHFSTYGVLPVPSAYKDMEPYTWAKDAITALSAREIVQGAGNNSYAPGRAVSRAEFLKMMMEAFEWVQADQSSSFQDVKSGQWYADAVASAEVLGIVTGYGDGTFGADRSITREEMAVITVRILKAAGEELPKQHDAVNFSDTPLISAFALDAVNLMAEGGFIEGRSSGNFAPKSQATRAEAAVLVARVMGLI